MHRLVPTFALAFTILVPDAVRAQQTTLRVDSHDRISAVSPTLYGLMTEEINYSYDGGLYAEMVRNRTFRKTWSGFDYWTQVQNGNSTLTWKEAEDGPSKALPHSLQLTIETASENNEAGLANNGYWGMAVRPATTYRGSFYANSNGVHSAHVRLISNVTGKPAAEAAVALNSGGWQQYNFTLQTSSAVNASGQYHLEILFAQPGTVSLQLVSLFPPTFHNRPNGTRPDLMKMMGEMKPHFLRLPGGNYLEGDFIKERFNWKETIGPLVERPTHRGPWGYQSTDGMGLLEMLEWCEDLKIEPLLAVYAGYSLKGEHVVGKALEPHIQDALDEIEYVTGDASSKWGAMRVRDGHPVPFPLHFVEIGNEDEFDKSKSYDDRFEQFARAIRAKYPQIKLIATTPVKKGNPDVIDDHYYRLPDEFFGMVHKYDTTDRNGPKIFVGEWATRTGSPTPDFGAALGDAAWMTGMERNSDIIIMASYAPLLTNVNPGGMQWSTDLIGYTTDKSYGSPSYWAQVLFAQHLGTHTVRTSVQGAGPRFFWSATADENVLHLKLVNASATSQPLLLNLEGVQAGPGKSYTLHAATRWATNSIDHPHSIEPKAAAVVIAKPSAWQHTVPGNTIEVLDLPLKPAR